MNKKYFKNLFSFLILITGILAAGMILWSFSNGYIDLKEKKDTVLIKFVDTIFNKSTWCCVSSTLERQDTTQQKDNLTNRRQKNIPSPQKNAGVIKDSIKTSLIRLGHRKPIDTTFKSVSLPKDSITSIDIQTLNEFKREFRWGLGEYLVLIILVSALFGVFYYFYYQRNKVKNQFIKVKQS